MTTTTQKKKLSQLELYGYEFSETGDLIIEEAKVQELYFLYHAGNLPKDELYSDFPDYYFYNPEVPMPWMQLNGFVNLGSWKGLSTNEDRYLYWISEENFRKLEQTDGHLINVLNNYLFTEDNQIEKG